jgi:predicted peptidase
MTAVPDNRSRYTRHEFRAADGYQLTYRLLSPRAIQPCEKYPLVILLHGAGERGSDNDKQLVHGANDFASDEVMTKYPAFVVAPQCPSNEKWVDVDWSLESNPFPEQPSRSLGAVLALIETLLQEIPMDDDRIYLTGLSMGGYACWDALARWPDRFAAAAIICGGGDPATVVRFPHVPIWAFHGEQDTAVKPGRTRDMIAALEAAGANPLYTEYAGVGHDSWSQTYHNPAFYAWLFAQRKQ